MSSVNDDLGIQIKSDIFECIFRFDHATNSQSIVSEEAKAMPKYVHVSNNIPERVMSSFSPA